MAKTVAKQKITPSIAKILAEKIVKEVTTKLPKLSQQVTDINKQVSNSPEVKEGMKLMKQLEALNKKINQKFDDKFVQGYKNNNYFSITGVDKKWISDYWLKEKKNAPNIEVVRDEILLESFFNGDMKPEDVIANYVAKYTKTV